MRDLVVAVRGMKRACLLMYRWMDRGFFFVLGLWCKWSGGSLILSVAFVLHCIALVWSWMV